MRRRSKGEHNRRRLGSSSSGSIVGLKSRNEVKMFPFDRILQVVDLINSVDTEVSDYLRGRVVG